MNAPQDGAMDLPFINLSLSADTQLPPKNLPGWLPKPTHKGRRKELLENCLEARRPVTVGNVRPSAVQATLRATKRDLLRSTQLTADTLDLCDRALLPEDYPALCYAIQSNHTYKTLNLGTADIPGRCARVLASSISSSKSIEKVDISQCKVSSFWRRKIENAVHLKHEVQPTKEVPRVTSELCPDTRAAKSIQRKEQTDRQRIVFNAKCDYTRYLKYYESLSAAARISGEEILLRIKIEIASIDIENEESRQRPAVMEAWVVGCMGAEEAVEQLRRTWLLGIEVKARSILRHVAHRGWIKASQEQQQRLAHYACERAAIEVDFYCSRTKIISEMLQSKDEVGERFNEAQTVIKKLLLERHLKEEEERRRLRQRHSEEQREKAWKEECAKQEQKRFNLEKYQQRSRITNQEEKARKVIDSMKVGKEMYMRQFIEAIQGQFLQLTERREKLGQSLRQYELYLEELPKLVFESTLPSAAVSFINAPGHEMLDYTLNLKCSLDKEWYVKVENVAQVIQQTGQALTKTYQAVKKASAAILQTASEKMAVFKMSFQWCSTLSEEVSRLGPENEALLGKEVMGMEEIEGYKMRPWGGSLKFSVVSTGAYSATLHINTPYIITEGKNGESSKLTVLLPTDGTATVAEISSTISSVGCCMTQEGTKKLPPFMQNVAVEVNLLVGTGAQVQPDRFVALQAEYCLSTIVQQKYLRIESCADFEYVEGADERPLVSLPVITESPTILYKAPTGLVLSQMQSNFEGSILSIEIRDYTPDDQIYLRRIPDMLWLEGEKVCMSMDRVIGTLQVGTLKRFHPPTALLNKIPPSQRGLQEMYPDDFGCKSPGAVHRILLTEATRSEELKVLVEALKFSNLSADPKEGPRNVVIGIKEPGRPLQSISFSITICGDDDAAVLTVPEKKLLFRSAVASDMPDQFYKYIKPNSRCVLPNTTLHDVDTTHFSGGYLKVSVSNGFKMGDRLFIKPDEQDCNAEILLYAGIDKSPLIESIEPGTGLDNYHTILDIFPRKSITRVVGSSNPDARRGCIKCYQLPIPGKYKRVQVWYEGDILGIATFVPPRGPEDQLTTSGKQIAKKRPVLNVNDCCEIVVQFSEMPHGLATIRGVQALLQSIYFGSTMLCPKDGVRNIDIELLIGSTVKKVMEDDKVKLVKLPICPNTELRERVSLRITMGLLRVPPKHSDFVYIEGSGHKRIAPLEVAMDDEGHTDSYSGGCVVVEIAEGLCEEDELSIKVGLEPDSLRLVPRPVLPVNSSYAELQTYKLSFACSDGTSQDDLESVHYDEEEEEEEGEEEEAGIEGEEVCSLGSSLLALASVRELLPTPFSALGTLIETFKEPEGPVRAERRHTVAHEAVAKRLVLLKEAAADDESLFAKADMIDVFRGDIPIGVIEASKGRMKCTFVTTSVVKRKDVQQVVKNITYMNTSNDPHVLKKLFRFSLMDGSSTTTTGAFVSCEIMAVNNPTDVLLMHDKWKYRQGCMTDPFERLILAPLGDACLEDPDTNNFYGGSLSFEATGGACKGDSLSFLTPSQQQSQIDNYNKRARSESLPTIYPPIVHTEKNAKGETTLYINNPEESFARLSFVKSPVMNNQRDLCISFDSVVKEVGLALVSYVLNCVGYSNTVIAPSPDRNHQGVRLYRVRVSDGKHKGDGKATVTVDFSLPLIHVQGMESSILFSPSTVVVCLLPKAVCTLPDKITLNDGFLEVCIRESDNPTSDAIFLQYQRFNQYHVKDGCLHYGQDLIGKYSTHRTRVRIDFLPGSRTVDRKRLQELFRLCYFAPCLPDDQICFVPPGAHMSLSPPSGDYKVHITVRTSDGALDQWGRLEVNLINVYLDAKKESKLVKAARKGGTIKTLTEVKKES